MGNWKVWLLIALGILDSLVAWALLSRTVWNPTTTPVGPKVTELLPFFRLTETDGGLSVCFKQ